MIKQLIQVGDGGLEIRAKLNNALMTYSFEDDLIFGTSPLGVAGTNAGAVVKVSGDTLHNGVYQITTHATNVNSGARMISGINSIVLFGGSESVVIFKTCGTLDGLAAGLGFGNTLDALAYTDCCCVKISGAVLTGECKNNNSSTVSTTSYTLSAGTWYRAVCKVNDAGTSAAFTLYADNSDIVLWMETITTNIPIGRNMHFGLTALLAGSMGTGTGVLLLDYYYFALPAARRIA